MRMILCRHGNTFAPGDKVVWVGGNDDLPLVARGQEQARVLAGALRRSGVLPDAVYCAPLRRTRGYAEIVLGEADIDREPILDERLREIDYGAWAGLSTDEIVQRFGAHELQAWQHNSVWPSSLGWTPGESELSARIEDFLEDMVGAHGRQDTILVVTSNGVLRYFLRSIPGMFQDYLDRQNLKVSTGNFCRIDHDDSGFKAVFWNKDPGCGIDL